MDSVTALFHNIDAEWRSQDLHDPGPYEVLEEVTIHPSLAKVIEASGQTIPTVFDPNVFNGREDDDWSEIGIRVTEQDELISFNYG